MGKIQEYILLSAVVLVSTAFIALAASYATASLDILSTL